MRRRSLQKMKDRSWVRAIARERKISPVRCYIALSRGDKIRFLLFSCSNGKGTPGDVLTNCHRKNGPHFLQRQAAEVLLQNVPNLTVLLSKKIGQCHILEESTAPLCRGASYTHFLGWCKAIHQRSKDVARGTEHIESESAKLAPKYFAHTGEIPTY